MSMGMWILRLNTKEAIFCDEWRRYSSQKMSQTICHCVSLGFRVQWNTIVVWMGRMHSRLEHERVQTFVMNSGAIHHKNRSNHLSLCEFRVYGSAKL